MLFENPDGHGWEWMVAHLLLTGSLVIEEFGCQCVPVVAYIGSPNGAENGAELSGGDVLAVVAIV